MHVLQDMFEMTAIALNLVIKHYHINGLHLFCDTLYVSLLTAKKNSLRVQIP